MFGSLVVVYPTRHEGGSLTFREGGNEWTFDSAKAVASHDGSCVGYATFFSDIDHEVSLVKSGYRVTVTYNLYFSDGTHNPSPLSSTRLTFQAEFLKLLDDPAFLPDGGFLGFGLRHVYPLEKRPKQVNALQYLKTCLKGSDADLLSVCQGLSLQADLWLLYQGDTTVLIPTVPRMEDLGIDCDICDYLISDCGAKQIRSLILPEVSQLSHEVPEYMEQEDFNPGDTRPPYAPLDSDDDSSEASRRWLNVHFGGEEYANGEPDMHIHWVTKPSSLTVLRSHYIAYGNDADLRFAYGYVTLIVKIGKHRERVTAQ